MQEHESEPTEELNETDVDEAGLFDRPVESFDEPMQAETETDVSVGRIIRLVLLVVVLIGLIAAIIISRGETPAADNESDPAEAPPEDRNEELIEAGMEMMRESMARGEYQAAEEKAGQLLDLAGADRRVGRLLVPLHFARYLATGGRDQNHLANTVRIFNTLIAGQDGSPDPERWDALAPEDALERMRGALADYPDWQEAARGRALRDTDMRWLLTRASLWRTAHQAAGSGEPTGDTAHKMAAWMALHIAPVHPDEVLDLPIDLLTQGRCSRPQAAWTLAELYRQVGLPCRALQVAGQDLLHVTPPGEDDFLVNAWMGVPLLELQTGRPLALARLRQDAGPWNELAVAGGFKQATAEDFQQAQLKLPLHPRTFYDRMVTFAHLVDMLPQKPATGLRPARYGPDATIAIWPPVMEQILHRSEPLWRWRLVRAREVSSLLEGIRQAQLLARAEDVPAQWENTREALRAMRNRADVPEGIRVLEQALEDAAWFAALADFDAGKPEEAEAKLDAYLEDHAEGRWRLPARVLLAEVYAATDRPEAAQDIWQDLPPARRLYGIYRAEGLISPPASDAASN